MPLIVRNGKEYYDRRSPRAIAIDRSLNAKNHSDQITDRYKNAPNRNDIEDYDDISVEKKEKPSEEGYYTPTPTEKKKLVRHFHNSMNPIEQHKDLLITKNVIKKKEDVRRWRKDPKYYDVYTVDTAPKELHERRIEVLRRQVPDVPMFDLSKRAGIASYRDFMRTKHGYYNAKVIKTSQNTRAFYHPVYKYVAFYSSRGGGKRLTQSIAHEYMHAIDYSKGRSNQFMFGFFKNPKNKLSLGKMNKIIPTFYNKAESFTRTKSFPYTEAEGKIFLKELGVNYDTYRKRNEEVYANWGASLVTDKLKTKKHTLPLYNMFKKAHKPLISEMKRSDLMVTAPLLGGRKWGAGYMKNLKW